MSIHTSGRSRCTSCPAPGITTRRVSDRSAHIRSTRAASTCPCSPNTSVVGTRSDCHSSHRSVAKTGAITASITRRSKRGRQPSSPGS